MLRDIKSSRKKKQKEKNDLKKKKCGDVAPSQ
jgi:hypothetical protein